MQIKYGVLEFKEALVPEYFNLLSAVNTPILGTYVIKYFQTVYLFEIDQVQSTYQCQRKKLDTHGPLVKTFIRQADLTKMSDKTVNRGNASTNMLNYIHYLKFRI